MHFRLATRKSSDSISRPSSSKLNRNNIKSEIIEQKAFEKLLKESAKETDLNKRLNDIKQNYDQNKFEELVTKLKDAESKNEYLTSIITQLQARRTVNSGYRPNISVNITNSNNPNTNANNSNLVSNNNINNTANSNTNTTTNNVPAVSKLNLNHICSIEPLRIRLSEKDEPRAPTVEESESIIKKLFELYKQQKQQVRNYLI